MIDLPIHPRYAASILYNEALVKAAYVNLMGMLMNSFMRSLIVGAAGLALLGGCNKSAGDAVNEAVNGAVQTATQAVPTTAQSALIGIAGGYAIDPVREASNDGRRIASQEVPLINVPLPAVNVAANAAKPNVIYILVDDMGFGDIGYNSPDIATPELDRMAREGVQLDRFYSAPICTPTRTALLTGRSSLQYGVTGPLDDRWVVAPNTALLPHYFKSAGYDTWMVGKWHLGLRERLAMPNARGFDYFYGFLGGFIDFYTHVYWDGLDWQRNGTTLREEGHATDLLTDDAIRLISERRDDDPFFMYLAYNAPHTPLQYPPQATDAYDGMANKSRMVYAQMVDHMDTSIGRLRAALEAEGIAENTLIVFTSDNGGSAHLGSDNGPLREGKGSVYEGGMRVPGLAVWPGTIPAGQVSEYPVFVQNWAPTLLEAAGIQAEGSPFADRSAWPALLGQAEAPLPGKVLVGAMAGTAIYEWPYKYLVETRRGQSTPDRALYNVLADPNETNDLSAEEPELAARLSKIIDDFDPPPSLFEAGTPPEFLYLGADGKIDFEVRLQEARPPWAEQARQ